MASTSTLNANVEKYLPDDLKRYVSEFMFHTDIFEKGNLFTDIKTKKELDFVYSLFVVNFSNGSVDNWVGKKIVGQKKYTALVFKFNHKYYYNICKRDTEKIIVEELDLKRIEIIIEKIIGKKLELEIRNGNIYANWTGDKIMTWTKFNRCRLDKIIEERNNMAKDFDEKIGYDYVKRVKEAEIKRHETNKNNWECEVERLRRQIEKNNKENEEMEIAINNLNKKINYVRK